MTRGVEPTRRDARSVARVLALSGVPIAAGCSRPLVREAQVAADVHGESGVTASTSPNRCRTRTAGTRWTWSRDGDGRGARHRHDRRDRPAHQRGDGVRKEPRLAERVEQVVMMGGGAHVGNRTRSGQGFDAPPLHDPAPWPNVVDPSVMTTRQAPLGAELAGTLTTGMTVADLRSPAPGGCTTSVAVTLDRDRFWTLVLDALERIGEGVS